MRLIGMLDSPYVRRVAIALEYLGVTFEHEAVSVFSMVDKFRSINPVVKAPTLVCDDGEVLMESSLILQFIEATHTGGRSLWPEDPVEIQHDFRATSLALAACEKSVQIVYEKKLRPVSVQYEPWLARVSGQLLSACAELEQEVHRRPHAFAKAGHASIATAVAWQFTQFELAAAVPASLYPALAELSVHMEREPAFLKYPPTGPGVPSASKDSLPAA